MRISDWSSDVCSSDLSISRTPDHARGAPVTRRPSSSSTLAKGRAMTAMQQFYLDRATEAGLLAAAAPLANVRERHRLAEIPWRDRKSVVQGTSVSIRLDLGCRRLIKTKNQQNY